MGRELILQSAESRSQRDEKAKQVHIARLLDESPWSILQKSIVLLSAMTIIFDGMDIQMMGFAIPAIASEWGITRAAFAPVLACGLFGVAIGAGLGGMIGDRIGRRTPVLLSVLVFSAATLAFAFAHSMTALLVLRTIAGLGIGGALPNVTTLTAEFTPTRRRPMAVTSAIVCIPIGGVVAGLISARVLMAGNWRALFYIGGGAPLLLLVVLIAALPESPRYLAKLNDKRAELVDLLGRMHIYVPADSAFIDDHSNSGPYQESAFSEIFGITRRTDTFAIWAAFFCSLMTVYLVFNWLPSVLTGLGLGLRIASQGLAAYNFGGIFGALLFGWWISRKGSRAPLITGTLAGLITAALLAVIPIHGTGSHVLLFTALTLHGLFVNAVQTTMYALAAHIYTTQARATGVACALMVGRTGAIVSALLGASLLGYGTRIYCFALVIGMGAVLTSLGMLRRHIEPVGFALTTPVS
jgi:MFS transporter, AAHS family, 4-hydroxybenzoate transporter